MYAGGQWWSPPARSPPVTDACRSGRRLARSARPARDRDALVAPRGAARSEGARSVAVGLAVGVLRDPAPAHRVVAVDDSDEQHDGHDHDLHAPRLPPPGDANCEMRHATGGAAARQGRIRREPAPAGGPEWGGFYPLPKGEPP